MRNRYFVSFNMEDEIHMEAYNAVMKVAPNQRSQFIINCIHAIAEEHRLENVLRQTIREELSAVSFRPAESAAPEVTATVDELPKNLLAMVEAL